MPRFHLPSRALLLKIVGGTVLALVLIVAVPPLRNAAALGASKAIVFVATPLAPDIADFKALPETTKLVDMQGGTIAELDNAQRRVPVKVKQLPPHVKQAVLAAEDQSFYSHNGVDASAVFRAFLRNAQGRTQGGSTITQQLAKINYTTRERTVFRKLKEVLYATKLEKKYTKDELLERYLNQVYFGEGAYGINAAAEQYFNKQADQLTPAEAALIAGKIRAPEAVNPRKQPKETKVRRDQVLRNMRQERWLTKQQYDEAVATPIELPPAPVSDPKGLGRAPHFTQYVKREARTLSVLGATPAERQNKLFTGGYTIQTTFDPKVFDATTAAVQSRLGNPGEPDTAVATVVPGDGAIRSLFGGLDFSKTEYDMSSLAGRQIGSSAKPFVYLAALRQGIDPRTTYDGTSGRLVACYRPDPVSNFAGEDLGGQITVDEALVRSVNVVFAQLGCDAGARNVKQTANDAGIPEDATNSLGGYFLGGFDNKGANALEMASAYATFAAKGVRAEPYSIAKIVDSAGNTIYEHKTKTKDVFKPEEVGVLNNPLQEVVKRGTGVAAKIGRPVAGKTGTTQNSVDAWFTGYTPQLATSVWVGFADNRPMDNVRGKRGVTGGSFPAQIFSDVMKTALDGVKPEPLFTASPDALNLQRKTPDTLVPPPSSDTSTTSSPPTTTGVPTTTTMAAEPSTTTTAAPGPRATSTTTTTAPTTTTTAKKATTTTSTTSTTTTSTTAAP